MVHGLFFRSHVPIHIYTFCMCRRNQFSLDTRFGTRVFYKREKEKKLTSLLNNWLKIMNRFLFTFWQIRFCENSFVEYLWGGRFLVKFLFVLRFVCLVRVGIMLLYLCPQIHEFHIWKWDFCWLFFSLSVLRVAAVWSRCLFNLY